MTKFSILITEAHSGFDEGLGDIECENERIDREEIVVLLWRFIPTLFPVLLSTVNVILWGMSGNGNVCTLLGNKRKIHSAGLGR